MISARKSVVVRCPGRHYRVLIERDGLDRIGRYLRESALGPSVVVVTDSHVGALYGERVLRSLKRARFKAALITIPPGERSKSLKTLGRIYDHLADLTVDRATTLVALGGGVVGDVAGFVAATYLRGLSLVHIPTTVLAQADSSVGGKTGVDLRQGKNLVGAFHQPRMILTDPETIRTLPMRHVRSGMIEVVKIGMALDAALFRFLEQSVKSLLALDADAYARAMAASIRIKAEVVAADERDQGKRMLLNYGHTIGHALEAVGNYRRWLHGEAVALGMAAAAEIAARKRILPAADRDRQNDLLARFGMKLRLPAISSARVVAHMELDKKAKAGRPAFVLTRRVGVASVHRTVSRRDVVQTLRQLGAGP